MNKEQPTYSVNNHGTKYWLLKNQGFHRLDGPAIEYTSGHKSWYINDFFIPTTELELSVGLPIVWNKEVALVVKQINHTLFQVLLGNKKRYLFSLADTLHKDKVHYDISSIP